MFKKANILVLIISALSFILGWIGTEVFLNQSDNKLNYKAVGKWFVMPGIASSEGGIWQRAWISRHAPMALSDSEAIYLARIRDDEGKLLLENCSYLVQGKHLKSRWWSVTIHDKAGFLPINSNGPRSLVSNNVEVDHSGRWTLLVARNQNKHKNWISTQNAGGFSLFLRIYGQKINLSKIVLPEVKKIGCYENN